MKTKTPRAPLRQQPECCVDCQHDSECRPWLWGKAFDDGLDCRYWKRAKVLA